MAIEDLEKMCEKCGYFWISEVDNLVECPKCKHKVDVEIKREENADLKEEIEILERDVNVLKENLKKLNSGSYQS